MAVLLFYVSTGLLVRILVVFTELQVEDFGDSVVSDIQCHGGIGKRDFLVLRFRTLLWSSAP